MYMRGRHPSLARSLQALQRLQELTWPIFDESSKPLGLVLRQWVEEDPNPTLGVRLLADPRWQEQVELMRTELFITRQGFAINYDILDVLDSVALQLERKGLLSTPSAIAFLHANAEGREASPPSRGLVIETRVYVRLTADSVAFSEDTPTFSINGPVDLVVGPLAAQASKVVLEHRDWVNERRSQFLVDRTEGRRAQVAAYRRRRDEDELDYIVVAADTWRGNHKGKRGTEAWKEHCDGVYHRVYLQRKRHQRRIGEPLELGAPPNWRVMAWQRYQERRRG
jgi:hypothetical protein